MSDSAIDKSQIERWKPLLEKLNDIPTLPIVATKVSELINNPNSSSADIAEVLKKDQVLTAKVLKLINSPYYGIPGEVTDVKRALAYLGFNTLAQLVLSVSVISMFSNNSDSNFSLGDFWKHALGTAVTSEVIAKKIGYQKPEECFTCGLLHDIGKLVLFQIAPEEFFKTLKLAEREKISFYEAEKKLEVPTHGYLGEYIANKWQLPMVIRMSIRYHHVDVTPMETILESIKTSIRIVSLANQIVVKNKIGYSGNASEGSISLEIMKSLNISEAQLQAISEQISDDIDNASAFLRSA
ncbi:MAG: HDOD domain-containing protein [Oligoflexia bacterium]|nr:HDOD domain-containing protein [Oligoflexia bacterium]